MNAFESPVPPVMRPQSVSDQAAPDKAMERHYSLEQIGELWGLSTRTVRKMFENEPGIIVFGNTGSIRGVLKKAKRWHLFADEIHPLPLRQKIGRALSLDQKLRLLKVSASRPEWQTASWAVMLALNTYEGL